MSRIKKLESHYQKQLKDYKIKDISGFIKSIVDADITKGKYARFLIESFLNDKFLEEDLIGGLDSTVGQAISLFDKHKSKLSVEQRSVYALDKGTKLSLYQSPGDLWSAVKQFQGELSGKELKKEEQDKAYSETEFIYKDEETGFQIISPLSMFSAKWWGKGTRWCTSAENDNMFDYYTNKSPLLIFVLPDSSKYQFWTFDKKIQFMDETDQTVSTFIVKNNYKYFKNLIEIFYLYDYIPDDNITLDFLMNILKMTEINFNTQKGKKILKQILNFSQHDDIYNTLVENNINVIEHFQHDKITDKMIINYFIENYLTYEKYKKTKFNPELNITDDICIEILKYDTMYFPYLPQKSQKTIDYMVENDPQKLLFHIKQNNYIYEQNVDYEWLLEKIIDKGHYIDTDDFQSLNIRKKYLQKNPGMLHFIPEHYIDEDLILYLLENSENISPYVLDNNNIWTQKIFEKYIEVTKNADVFFVFKNKHFQKMLSHDNILLFAKTNKYMLTNIDMDLITDDIIIEHIKYYPENFFRIPKSKLNDSIYMQCFKNNFQVLEHIPKNIKEQFSYDFYLENIKKYPNLLYHIPQQYKDLKLVKESINNGGSLLFVPYNFIRKPSLFNTVFYGKKTLNQQEINMGLKNDPSAIAIIPRDKLTKENYACAFKADPFVTLNDLPREYRNDIFLKENFDIDFDFDQMELNIKLTKQIIRYKLPENIKQFFIKHSEAYRTLHQQEMEKTTIENDIKDKEITNENLYKNEIIVEKAKKDYTKENYENFKRLYQNNCLTNTI